MDDIERCAQLLGMRRREVLEVVPADGGDLVRTHDGQWTLIREDGGLVSGVDGPSLAAGEESAASASSDEDGPAAKPAPKRRSRA